MLAAYLGCTSAVRGDPRDFGTLISTPVPRKDFARHLLTKMLPKMKCSKEESGGVSGTDGGDRAASGELTREGRADSISVESPGEESAGAALSAGRDGEGGKSEGGETGVGAGVIGLGKYSARSGYR